MITDIENLYECYEGDVRRFALYLCGDAAMADEITSDTFMRAWMTAEPIRQPTVKSYLFTIARNAYIDLLRRASRHTQLDENMRDTRISAQTQMEQVAEVRAVLAALQQLPELERTVMLMRTLERNAIRGDREGAGNLGGQCKGEGPSRKSETDANQEGLAGGHSRRRSKIMKVTRQVVTDLLPIYLAGEASEDTKTLVEDYFRQDPDFERIARSAATPLEALRSATPIAASPDKKKRDLESVLWGLRRRTWLLGASLFLTLTPLSFDLTQRHLVSLGFATVLGTLRLTGA